MIRALLLIALATGLFMAQRTVHAQEGTATRCDNYASTAESHRCKCGRAMHSDCSQPTPRVEMDKACSTYCKEQNCHCISQCSTEHHHI